MFLCYLAELYFFCNMSHEKDKSTNIVVLVVKSLYFAGKKKLMTPFPFWHSYEFPLSCQCKMPGCYRIKCLSNTCEGRT